MDNQNKKPYSPMKVSQLGSFQNLTQAMNMSGYTDAMGGTMVGMGMA